MATQSTNTSSYNMDNDIVPTPWGALLRGCEPEKMGDHWYCAFEGAELFSDNGTHWRPAPRGWFQRLTDWIIWG